ncbi:MAG: insulinase family protein [Acidobacteria bacterium]|nr:insulinase family protein [Acidobacteriota bacterium]
MLVDRSTVPLLGSRPSYRFPPVDKQTLPNGVAVWTIEHHDLPVVAFTLLFPVGSASDPPPRPGLAALTADMLDEGTGDWSAIEVHDALARLGAQFIIEVGFDSLVMQLKTLARFTERALRLLADIVLGPRFDPVDLERVRDLRLNRLVTLRDLPPALAERTLARALYQDHPYGHVPLGTEAALRAIDVGEVREFYETKYLSGDPTLIVVGDVVPDEIARAAMDAFGEWPRGERSPGPPAAEPLVVAPDRLVLLDRPSAPQSELRIGAVAAPRSTPDYFAMLVLNMILGGQFTSRLNTTLRQTKGYTYGVRSVFDFRRQRGPFVVDTSVRTDATAESISEVLAEMHGILGDRPVSDAELDAARAALTRGYLRNFETADQLAHAAVQLALYELPETYFDEFVPHVNDVDRDAVERAAATYFAAARIATVVVGDKDRVRDSLTALGLGAPAEIDAAEVT